MDKKITISIIVPCLNEKYFIEDMIESVAKQTFNNRLFEVLIVDGGSDNETQQILQKLNKKYSFIKILYNKNMTASYAMNLGIKNARGRFIARMDVHANYPKDYLTRLYNAIIETGGANVGCCIETLSSHNTNKARSIAYALSSPFGVGNSYFRIGIKKIKEVDTVPFGFFHQKLCEQIGFFDTELSCGEDHEFNARINKAGMKIYLIPGEKVRYFARENFTKLSLMMSQYGFSRPVVNKKIGSAATLRQFFPLILVLSFFISICLAFYNPLLLVMLTFIYVSTCIIAALHIVRSKIKKKKFKSWLQIIMSFIVCHFSYGLGYIRGLLNLLFKNDVNNQMIKITR